MADAFEEQEWVKFGVAATLSKQYAADQRHFLESLATLLEGTMGEEAEIERKGGFLSKKTVRRIAVHLDDYQYTLEDTGRGPLQAARVRVVRGIALKTETIGVDEWVTALSEHIDERAKTNQAVRDALGRLVD